jgi:DNA-directed RNA polymerase specialized sigma24 family protein
MGVEITSAYPEPTMRDLARALERGDREFRAVLEPLLPALYVFLARRCVDDEEVEDLLIETLRSARSRAVGQSSPDSSLLGWLLRSALGIVRLRVEQNPVLDAGLAPNWAVREAEVPRELLDALARLSWDERQMLGMRYGDALPPALVSEVLGTGAEEIDRAVARVARHAFSEWLSVGLSTRIGVSAVDRDAPGIRAVGVELSKLATAVALTPAMAARVWRRVAEEGEETFVAGRALPELPAGMRAVLLAIGLAVLLALAAVWLRDGGPPPDPPRTRAVARLPREPNATGLWRFPDAARISPAPERRASAGATPPAEEVRRQAERQATWRRHEGRIYYLDRSSPYETVLTVADLQRVSDEGVPEMRVIARRVGSVRAYAVARDGVRVVSGGDTVWLYDGERERRLLDASVPPRRQGRPPLGWVGAMTWHPNGRTLALSVGMWPTRIQVLQTDDPAPHRGRREVAVLEADEWVDSLAFSGSGRYVLGNTSRGVVLIDMLDDGAVSRLPVLVREASWSSGVWPERLLWTGGEPAAPGNTPFGTINPDGSGLRRLGLAEHVAWAPDGVSVLAAVRRSPPNAGLGFWRYHLRDLERQHLASVAGVPEPLRDVAWGPDGRHFAYGSQDGVTVIHIGRGRAAPLPGIAGAATSVTWQADGEAADSSWDRPPPSGVPDSGGLALTKGEWVRQYGYPTGPGTDVWAIYPREGPESLRAVFTRDADGDGIAMSIRYRRGPETVRTVREARALAAPLLPRDAERVRSSADALSTRDAFSSDWICRRLAERLPGSTGGRRDACSVSVVYRRAEPGGPFEEIHVQAHPGQ